MYDIRAAGAEAPRGCFVKDNSQGGSNRDAACESDEMKVDAIL